ncbi:MAG: transcriptional regulator BetI [Hyphomicrobiales bacterium]|nr:MAG: transcriptional regulator BetI [Hyphomicrobiales bacterium]
MPKVGMEPIRRRALIEAAIAEIHARGSLDVTVGHIAERAKVSSGLAHHYFGNKAQLLTATMRHLLAELRTAVAARLRAAATPRARLQAVIEGSFAPDQFQPAVISAWLAFYAEAQSSEPVGRLLRLYGRRLHSNLMDALTPMVPRADAERIAEGTAALIDGFWLRQALGHRASDRLHAVAMLENYVETQLAAADRGETR